LRSYESTISPGKERVMELEITGEERKRTRKKKVKEKRRGGGVAGRKKKKIMGKEKEILFLVTIGRGKETLGRAQGRPPEKNPGKAGRVKGG